MAKRQTNYSDPLDELLEKLNSGEFVDQSMHEFNEVVKDTVKNYDCSVDRVTYDCENSSKNCCREFHLSPDNECHHNQGIVHQGNNRTKSKVPVEADCCIKPDECYGKNKHDDRTNHD